MMVIKGELIKLCCRCPIRVFRIMIALWIGYQPETPDMNA